MEEQLLKVDQVAAKLCLGKRTVFRMRNAGLICAPLKCGQGAIRWRLSDIEKWIAMGCPTQKKFTTAMNREKKRQKLYG